MKWISAKDFLPESSMDCLVIIRLNNFPKRETCPWITVRRYSIKRKWGYKKKNVEFWAPIPKIPKGIINGKYCEVQD